MKTEADGRMFPTTDDSQTIIDCLTGAAQSAGVVIKTKTAVTTITPSKETGALFQLSCSDDQQITSRNILLAAGGNRSKDLENLLRSLGHETSPAVPSLFTFNIPDPELKKLAGLSAKEVEVGIPSCGLNTTGPVLITHWGLSGPGILKLSAWGARQLHEQDYRFDLKVNWIPGIRLEERLEQLRKTEGKRTIFNRSPFPEIPRRLWEYLVTASSIDSTTTWSQLSKPQSIQLLVQLTSCNFQVQGKSTNKEEFVTCGGVQLFQINLRSMESRLVPGLYFAGEILDIDGITGGFNFQNAWTTGYLAGIAIAQAG
jgi:predicted Rossmann fold flavoprotein